MLRVVIRSAPSVALTYLPTTARLYLGSSFYSTISPGISSTKQSAALSSFSLTSKSNNSASDNAKSPRPARKLRARKAAITLTPAAVSQLRQLLDEPVPKLIKVGVKQKGCSGLAYNLEYVEKPGLLDEEVIQDGVKVIIDSKALFSIIGSEMDWVEDKLTQKFIFRNPNISKYNFQYL